jgi:hypothetical protein
MVIAHVGGVPLEEILPSVTGAGAGLLLARAWLMLHLRQREPRTGPTSRGSQPSNTAARATSIGSSPPFT